MASSHSEDHDDNQVYSSGTSVVSSTVTSVKLDKDSSGWFHKKWRPAMGWSYLIVCMADFVIFPVLWSLLQAFSKGQVTSQWEPLSIQGGGLYHIAMGAVVGVTAYGRTKEKIVDKN